MTEDTAQLLLFALAIVALTPLMGRYMARVYAGERTLLTPVVAPVERAIYRLGGIDPAAEQRWTRYATSVIALNLVGTLAFYAILRLQDVLPLNPRGLGPVEPALAFNTAISFITSTNWQAYAGERTLSYFSQMAGCTVYNFVSTASAMGVAIAVMRGFATSQTRSLGNFHVDFIRTNLYVLLPVALISALFLVFEGVPQTLADYASVKTVEGGEQIIARGPVASQVAIKMLGTNGGGFFNANGAHPFENPTPLSNFVQAVLMLLIPAALTYTFGTMVGDTRQGWALFSVMAIVFVLGLVIIYAAERAGNPMIAALPIDQMAGNMEGKETRFGMAGAALWAAVGTTTAAGAVNSSLDSYTPIGGMVPMMNVQLSEVIFGGAGSGFYNLVFYIVLAMFIAGLMVGRSPDYLGKKIEVREIKLAVLTLLIVPLGMLLLPAIAIMIPAAAAAIQDHGPHGLSELLYAYASATAANGSAFAGFDGGSTFHLTAQGLAMLAGRFAFIIAGLAIAGSIGAKRTAVAALDTVPTHTPLFVALMVAVIFIFGALSFFPAVALGPLAEHFEMRAGRSF
ncbi:MULTISPECIES: potassium-transporting ATPase subunit KdpA [Rhodomicrobium]|uniref:potassium-transporting ATPase subunit KdpA n=1 Tax=Rhodomicrobium TaxID=1068 RepID=UPI000B4BB586|nr:MULTISPECIES: potassium-transporting ATPase subunit KdpA [Rhodomicrobium]